MPIRNVIPQHLSRSALRKRRGMDAGEFAYSAIRSVCTRVTVRYVVEIGHTPRAARRRPGASSRCQRTHPRLARRAASRDSVARGTFLSHRQLPVYANPGEYQDGCRNTDTDDRQ